MDATRPGILEHACPEFARLLVIATPEPTALADAYATIKVLATQQGRAQVQVAVNQTQRLGEGRQVAQQLQAAQPVEN